MKRQRDCRSASSAVLLMTVIVSGVITVPHPSSAAMARRYYIPFMAKNIVPKGIGLYAGNCDLLDMLNVSWYYSGEPSCEGYEFVEYITCRGDVGRKKPTSYTLLWNEPEYRTESIEEMVGAFVPLAEAHPEVIWIGPCPANDLGLIPAFWREFERQAGWAMPPERIRVCVHCYASAGACMQRVAAAAGIGEAMGIPSPSVWLTEFGQPLGLNLTIHEQVTEMSRLVDALKASPDIERFAYWPGILRAGIDVWNGKYSSWQPLAFERYGWDRQTLLEPGLTDVGLMYRDK